MQEFEIEVVDQRGEPDPVVEAIATTGLAIAEQGALLSNQALANAVASNDLSAKVALARQDAGSRLRLAILSQAVGRLQNSQPLSARSAVNAVSNNELAQTVADLKAAATAFVATRRK